MSDVVEEETVHIKEEPTDKVPTKLNIVEEETSDISDVMEEETVYMNEEPKDIAPIKLHIIKEETLDIIDVVEEETVYVKEEPKELNIFIEETSDICDVVEEIHADKKENVVDFKVTNVVKELQTTINAHNENYKSGPIPAVVFPKENDDLIKTCKRKYSKRKNKVIKVYPCNFCDMKFSCQGYLNRHLKVHNGEKPFKCENCNKSFSQMCHLKQHKRRHTGEKPYTCHICKNKAFNHHYNYKTHMKKHFGVKTQKCDLCSAEFHQKFDLKRHILSHSGEKPFGCDFCQTKFTQKYHMLKHIKLYHTEENSKEYATSSQHVDKKNDLLGCKLLPKVLKPFTCTYIECLQSFKRKGTLINHINRIHLGITRQKNELNCDYQDLHRNKEQNSNKKYDNNIICSENEYILGT